MSLEALTKDIYKPIRGYAVDDAGHVIGLRLVRTHFKDGDILAQFEYLQALVLQYTLISDFQFLKSLNNLNSLYLNDENKITDYSFLQDLQSLTTLDLVENNIMDISFLQGLQSLTTLRLGGNNITDTSFLQGLQSLTTLDLWNNNITDISFLQGLKSLITLNFGFNKITDISYLQGFQSLTALNLGGNNITDYSYLRGLQFLTTLDLRRNNITDISFLRDLNSLTTLDLRNNNITDISAVAGLINLDNLYVDNNPVEIPPPEIVKEGLSAIRNYFKSIASSKETVFLYEAKLLVVGAGDVGKTCLMHKLMSPNREINVNEISTLGIDIKPWIIDIGNIKDFCVNFWDFGGQEILHSTHQFFLTKRSVYLFVWDSRGDDNLVPFDYWLNVVRLLSNNSPVICVQNKIDHATFFL